MIEERSAGNSRFFAILYSRVGITDDMGRFLRMHDPMAAVLEMEHKKRLVLSNKAIERSRLLVLGSKELLKRAQEAKDTAARLREEIQLRKAA